MKRNLILIGIAILVSIGSFVYGYNLKSVQTAETKKDCCSSSAEAGKSCCAEKK
jgi:hypothetical protein